MKTTKVRVVVTQKDIDKGAPNTCESCPIARALVNQGFRFYVRMGWLQDPESGYQVATLSKRATEFISRFDQLGRMAVMPFTLYVSLPTALVRKARAKR